MGEPFVAHARHVLEVLHREREPVQVARRRVVERTGRHQPRRVLPGAFDGQRRQRVHRPVRLRDALDRRVDHLQRRHLARSEPPHRLPRRHPYQVIHPRPPPSFLRRQEPRSPGDGVW